jgi:hypothetical protein
MIAQAIVSIVDFYDRSSMSSECFGQLTHALRPDRSRL